MRFKSIADEINYYITRLENYKPSTHDVDWCADRVAWAWKWRKITKEQKDDFTDRIVFLYDRGY